jgi:hypothetical protein
MFASAPPPRRSAGLRLLEPGRARRRRHRRRPAPILLLALVALVVGAGATVAVVRHHHAADQRRAVAERFLRAWARGDRRTMWAQLDARARAATPLVRFERLYDAAGRAATQTAVRVGAVGPLRRGVVAAPVAVATRELGTLSGTIALPVHAEDGGARVAWTPRLRLPGLRAGEGVRRVARNAPQRASVLAADGTLLGADPATAALAGRPPTAGDPGSGLERLYDARLAGRPTVELRFGARVVARVPGRPSHAVRATIQPGLQRAAAAALGSRLGGVAVLRPRDGSVLALAGLAVSAPQPPGSTFKIVTLAGALQAGLATPASRYPVRTFATLSGVKLRNAGDEACGGTLAQAFASSCNSVFAPLGARLGAQRLTRVATAFGFGERPPVPAARVSAITPPARLRDDLAVGASAIGQAEDLATPLQMATVAGAIGAHGLRARPRVVRSEPVVRRRAASARVARQVRTMMLGVVRGGTGTAAAIPGVQVAGKTGTAELRSTVGTTGGREDPKNTDAWFVAFAPASAPRVAVAVMLVGAGAGGRAAAPIARAVLLAALR